ncbi:MAG: EAL domain-containing protein [Sulfuricurvum sp.]|uniref:bifunctional diguanylate cyclase/phosphodiesterase n=1 Tax=Sulfuricurvum sp. TaxID=2025608 RepID=UPI0026186C55|nr:EAL domain-containing protein [Sulfuricurvum sp.]MDD5160165.1 EAL domain-containing protein [Sulfuricurvum sp.]
MTSSKYFASPLARNFWQSVAVLILFGISFVVYVYSEKQIDRANEMRLHSFLLADELRHSSDDLTRMVRTYIATGNPIYKAHYQEILDIRNGLKPRPLKYQNIYWDLVGLDDKRPRGYSTQAIPLIEMMRQSGFTQTEFAKLTEAKNNSDTLTETEYAAMKLIESKASSPAEKDIQQHKAMELLHDEFYHQAKASIMRPIDEFYLLMQQRTDTAVHNAQIMAFILRIVFIFIGIIFMFMLRRLNQTLNTILGSSVDEVHAHITRIGRGDFSHLIRVDNDNKNSVLGWLSETQERLKQLISNNERLKQLYSALSQCNQAIVRSKNEEELFPIICRDAVNFGGMKMAWIGIHDESTQELKVVSYYGSGTDYLKELIISTDPDNPTACGPTGRSLHENRPIWCQDFQNDPSTAQWHEKGRQYGWGSSAALPLHRSGKGVGVFTLYAKEAGAFDEPVQKLLEEMVMDISYALETFDRDIARKQAEEALQKKQNHLMAIIDNEPECVKLVDTHGNLLEMNPAGLAMLEADTLEEAQKCNLIDYLLPEWRASFIALHKQVMKGENALLEFEIKGLRGTRRWLETHATPLRDTDGNVSMLLGITRDTTERKQQEEQIRYLANFDHLTGLPNRTQLDNRIKDLLSFAKRHKNHITVMFLDLDRFKEINDSLGHNIGDILLIESSARITSLLREEDTVARLGGDEFILLLPNTKMEGAAQVAQKLLDAFKAPFHIEYHELTISISIGIALYPDDGTDFETLYKNADTAMYRAKHNGRDTFSFFTDEMQRYSIRNLELSNALRHALNRNELQLHYQPQFSSQNGTIIGAEALLRWTHPDFGMVSPAEFIPIAEENGTILSIGEWVLRTAAKQAKMWLEQGYPAIIMAVNLSAVQFRSSNLPLLVTTILEEVGLPPEYLELELTESVAMHDPQRAINVMNDLNERGVRMSIDDFGTGYSSLNYLKKFNIYKLKIDQSFVREIDINPEDKAIVAAIIIMAKSLGLQTIAEGVETIEQFEYLREQGCNEIQGYYFSKPLPQEIFEAFRESH